MNIAAIIFVHIYRLVAMHALLVSEEIARAAERIVAPGVSLKPMDVDKLIKDATNIGTSMYNFSEAQHSQQIAAGIINQYKTQVATHQVASKLANTANLDNAESN